MGKTPKKTKRADDTTSPKEESRAEGGPAPEGDKRAEEAATPRALPRTPEQSRFALKKKVRYFYDIQRLRLQTAGRTYERANTIDLHEIDIELLNLRAKNLEKTEKEALGDVGDHLKTMPFYVKVLSDKTRYRGIGPTMAGVILSEFDIHREDTASKMWAFAGLAPKPALRCKACHDVVEEASGEAGFRDIRAKHRLSKTCSWMKSARDAYMVGGEIYESGQAMRPTRGEKLPYNAWLRTKLVGVLGPVMLKVGSPWKKAYDEYKQRKVSAGWGRSDAHRHQAAIRYMIKMLLLDIWKEWRTFEGLVVRPSYHEEKLGHTYSGTHPGNASRATRDTHAPDASQPAHDTRIADAFQDEIDMEVQLIDD